MKAEEALKTEGKKADRADFPVMLDQGLWVHHIVREKSRTGISRLQKISSILISLKNHFGQQGQ